MMVVSIAVVITTKSAKDAPSDITSTTSAKPSRSTSARNVIATAIPKTCVNTSSASVRRCGNTITRSDTTWSTINAPSVIVTAAIVTAIMTSTGAIALILADI